MTFTEEQLQDIEAAVRKVLLNKDDYEGKFEMGYPAAVIAELTRPQPEFREGEVVCCTQTGNYYLVGTQCGLPADRKLRLSEMPEAVERLRSAAVGALARAEIYDQHFVEVLAVFDREIEP